MLTHRKSLLKSVFCSDVCDPEECRLWVRYGESSSVPFLNLDDVPLRNSCVLEHSPRYATERMCRSFNLCLIDVESWQLTPIIGVFIQCFVTLGVG